MADHYKTLNVTRDAENVVIESAYRALMKRYHPDKTNGDPVASERAKRINAAYSILKDSDARARYDRTLDSDPVDSFAADPEPAWGPETWEPVTPMSPRGSPHTGSGQGVLASVFFMMLATTVGVGAIGSIFNSAPEAASAAEENTSDPASLVPSSSDGSEASLLTPSKADKPAKAAEITLNETDACKSASTSIEYLICSDPAVAAADRRLNTIYSARLKADGDTNSLRAGQRDWLAGRDRMASDRDALLAAYDERIRELQLADIDGLY